MKKILLIMAILLCALSAYADFGVYAGIGASTNTEHNFDNPLGFIGVNYRFKHAEIYGEHLSSFPNKHDKGLNMFGINATTQIKDIEIYAGIAIHDQAYDSSASHSQYGQDFPDVFVRAGMRYSFIFGEVLHDRFIGGVRIEF